MTMVKRSTGRSAVLIAIGVLCSRLAGLIRQRVFSHYFGLRNDTADAFTAAFRIPNVLQNLFGEGALSASFIPVYASLLARGEHREADRVAGAIASLLSLIVAAVVLTGVFATPLLIDAIAPGFHGEKRALTIAIVRVLFPGAGLFVVSAWCLGVLNSHHRFLLSYASPVMWNAAMIATLAVFGGREELPRLAIALAWGSVVGSALQFAVQLPVVWRLAPDLRFALDVRSEHVRAVTRGFFPVLLSRGVSQISAYIDQVIASLLGTGAVTGLQNASTLYTLPVSLFGISVSAAELPAMSGAIGLDPAGFEALRGRLNVGLRRIAFFIVPSAVAFLALGDVIVAALFQTGRFEAADSRIVWGILAGSAVGLLASTLGRLWLPVCETAAGCARDCPDLGDGRPHGIGRRRRMGRDAHAAPDDERANRRDGFAGKLRREAVDVGNCRRGRCVGTEDRVADDASDHCGRRHPRSVRRGVLRRGVGDADP
jgi:putative peptidoglycan lipid II flippase